MYLKFGKYCDLFGVTQMFLFCVSEFKYSVVQESFGFKCFFDFMAELGAFLKSSYLAGNFVVEIIL